MKKGHGHDQNDDCMFVCFLKNSLFFFFPNVVKEQGLLLGIYTE